MPGGSLAQGLAHSPRSASPWWRRGDRSCPATGRHLTRADRRRVNLMSAGYDRTQVSIPDGPGLNLTLSPAHRLGHRLHQARPCHPGIHDAPRSTCPTSLLCLDSPLEMALGICTCWAHLTPDGVWRQFRPRGHEGRERPRLGWQAGPVVLPWHGHRVHRHAPRTLCLLQVQFLCGFLPAAPLNACSSST